jgi:hypothetical protein
MSLHEEIDYDPTTGIFKWKRGGAHREKGAVAGTISRGYRVIKLEGKYYQAGQLAWYLSYGVWPTKTIDHINRNRGDNRLSNLREVTQSENIINSPARLPHGEKYIYWEHAGWVVAIKRNYRKRYLGRFRTFQEAVNARDIWLSSINDPAINLGGQNG